MFQIEGTVPSVVLDVGSHTVKAGLSGEDLPHSLLPAAVSTASAGGGAAGASAQAASADARAFRGASLGDVYAVRPRAGVEVLSPFDADGLVKHWARFEALVGESLDKGLQVPRGEHAMLYAEPNHTGRKERERLAETFFEGFGAPAVYLAKTAVLAAFASGRTTGVVLDIGHSGVSAVPVLEGALVKGTLLRCGVGGAAVSAALARQLAAAGHRLRPLWAFRRGEGGAVEDAAVDGVAASYHEFAVSRVLEEVKAGLCRVYDGAGGGAPEAEWELPDGNVVRMAAPRFEAAEATLFAALPHAEPGPDTDARQSYVQRVVRAEAAAAGFPAGAPVASSAGVDGLVLDAVRACDASTHRDMYAGVCLTGGTSDIAGLYERISTGLAKTYHKVRVLAATGSMERKYCAWTGGSILGTFSEFQRHWISKGDYEETGASIVHRQA